MRLRPHLTAPCSSRCTFLITPLRRTPQITGACTNPAHQASAPPITEVLVPQPPPTSTEHLVPCPPAIPLYSPSPSHFRATTTGTKPVLELRGVVRGRRSSGVAYARILPCRPLPCRPPTRPRPRPGCPGAGGRCFPRLHRRRGLHALRRLQSALHGTRANGTSAAGWYSPYTGTQHWHAKLTPAGPQWQAASHRSALP